MNPQGAAAADLTLKRLFAPPALDGPTPREARVSPDGRLITYLKPDPKDQTSFDLWAAPASGGPARLLLQGSAVEPRNAALTEAERARRERMRTAAIHGVIDYAWSEAGDLVLVPAAGKLNLVDPATGALRTVGEGAALDPKITPKGGYVTYVRDQNLHALNLKTLEDRTLTSDGGGAVSYGVAEFVAQEEMNRSTGQWPSPDDRLIAYARVDESRVEVAKRLEVGPDGSRVAELRYPKAGGINADVSLFIAPLSGGPARAVDLGPDRDVYLARVAWAKDAKTLYVQRENRAQTRLDLLAVDPRTGVSRVLLSETAEPWINLNSDFTPLTDGGFIWGSERTGFHHLYLYDREGRLVRPLTAGDWPVAEADPAEGLAVDEARGLVYFAASKESPLTRDVYRVSLRTPGPPVRITSGDGWWTANFAKNGAVFIGAFTDPRTPPQAGVYDRDGRRLFWLEENSLSPDHPIAPYLDRRTYPEFGTLTAEDGQTLHYALTRPVDFDPKKRYPAVVLVYGGPHEQTVRRVWQPDTDQILTQAGFVVFRLDNRGSSNRGLRFESPIHEAMGGPEVRDQIRGRTYLAGLPFVDPSRIGVYGWSYGGYMTLRLLTEPGAGFAAGASGAPPTDWRFYDTHYTERYMSDPRTAASAYDAAAVLPRLGVLAEPGAPRLLLMQGMADDNVLFENSIRVMADLQARSTPFDLMLFPGERHGLREPEKRVQQWRTILEFFERTLGGPRPA